MIDSGEQFKILARNPLNQRCQASPAISQGNIFIRGDQAVYCIGAQ